MYTILLSKYIHDAMLQCLCLFHDSQIVRDSKLSTCLAPDFLNFHTRGQLCQQECPLNPVNLEDTLNPTCQHAFLSLVNCIYLPDP